MTGCRDRAPSAARRARPRAEAREWRSGRAGSATLPAGRALASCGAARAAPHGDGSCTIRTPSRCPSARGTARPARRTGRATPAAPPWRWPVARSHSRKPRSARQSMTGRRIAHLDRGPIETHHPPRPIPRPGVAAVAIGATRFRYTASSSASPSRVRGACEIPDQPAGSARASGSPRQRTPSSRQWRTSRVETSAYNASAMASCAITRAGRSRSRSLTRPVLSSASCTSSIGNCAVNTPRLDEVRQPRPSGKPCRGPCHTLSFDGGRIRTLTEKIS